jgi:hypothetical protein
MVRPVSRILVVDHASPITERAPGAASASSGPSRNLRIPLRDNEDHVVPPEAQSPRMPAPGSANRPRFSDDRYDVVVLGCHLSESDGRVHAQCVT